MKKFIFSLFIISCFSLQAQVAGRIGSGINQQIRLGQNPTEVMEYWNFASSAYGITNQPLLWIKASAHTFRASDGDAVPMALDYSGRGNNLTQATSTKQPTYLRNGFNFQPTFRFDGGDCLTNISIGVSTYTVFIVMSNSAHGIVMEHSADASANPGSYIYSTTTCGHLINRGGTLSSKNGTTGWGINNKVLTEVSFDGTHAGNTGTTNDVLVFSATCASANDPGTGTATAALNVGGRNAASTFLTGHISEILWYSPKLSSGDATIVRNQIKTKYAFSF